MGKEKNATGRERIDPDDAPEPTDEWFATADYDEGDNLVRRGRPESDSPQEAACASIPTWSRMIGQRVRGCSRESTKRCAKPRS
jgi:hypothetical protein